MDEFTFFVPGKCETKGSTKSWVNPKTNRIVTRNDNERAKNWQYTVSLFAKQAYPYTEPSKQPVILNFEFVLDRPKQDMRHGKNQHLVRDGALAEHTKKPDADKLIRCAIDGLTNIIYEDDNQVIGFDRVRKRYQRTDIDDDPIGVYITVKILPYRTVKEKAEHDGSSQQLRT